MEMPLMRSGSHEAVNSNVKELIRSGRKPKQAIAIALSNQRKYKRMADGGQVVADGGMGDVPSWERPMGGDVEPLSKMNQIGPEDGQRDLAELNQDANYYPSRVANPGEMDRQKKMVMALRKMGMDSYAMGGLIQDGPAGDEPVGNKPSENMSDSVEDTEVDSFVGKPSMENPSGMGLSMEAKAAIERKKKMRRYA